MTVVHAETSPKRKPKPAKVLGKSRAEASTPKSNGSVEMLRAVDQSILSALSGKDIDLSRINYLRGLQAEMRKEIAESSLEQAFALMQPALPRIARKGKAPAGKRGARRYARWEDACDAIMPVLKQYGFTLTFETNSVVGGVRVTAVLTHEKGGKRVNALILPPDTGYDKNEVQALGSAVSYGKRYTVFAMLNIISEDDDDDGAGGAEQATLSYNPLEDPPLEDGPEIVTETLIVVERESVEDVTNSSATPPHPTTESGEQA